MIAELGLAALWLAAAFALLQAFAGIGHWRSLSPALASLTRPVAVMQGLLCLIAFGCLIWLFAVTDLSVLLVASNSHVDKPMVFKLAGAWGNHEGSMLLWVTVLSLAGAAIALFEKRLDQQTLGAALFAQALLGLGFFAFLLFSSNPFERLDPAPPTGAGLNPLLQDIGLAFHPPTLYIGYVGLSVGFSFAVAALLTGKVGPTFARAMRPWVLLAWIFLTIGITAGSYWAYYELGWGGWWFWDPVENASLMPWLAATALLHSVAVLATRDALRAWTIMLALVAFAMAMAGTFLVRSGILTSVHAFAVDPERGAFILGLLAIYVGGAFALFGLRIGVVREGKTFALLSREGAIVGNNIFLSVILAIVLVGTLWPLAAEAMGDKISVGPPYFNQTTVPIALLLMLLLIVGPVLRWRGDMLSRHKSLLLPAVVFAGSAVVLFSTQAQAGVWPIMALSLAIATAVGSVLPLIGRNLLRTPLPVWGMALAHLGFAVSVAGMAAESGWKAEKLAALSVGDSASVSGWNVKLADVRPVVGDNWVALEGQMEVRRGGDATVMLPQSRQFSNPKQQTTEAALLTRWDGQLYAVIAAPAEGDVSDRWQVRLWWKPFVTLIWYGGLLIALGGSLALIGRIGLFRRKRARSNLWSGA
ncbi:MAG: heme lyase CcmF/NrfE family subunit [Sphingomonadales bacterium]|jgi:cytochrome c-type biogenesis protein CcmF|nr:heme lyase CcmF/NrfE family subunit [Sphingomonadales bacterium]MBK9003258.1 heme lyase CcmF/NrfE family subunit [Sphingomonadales bacterium]MBK9268506.1 heme lyase CcmF/NrfE family subunit [Sphingomonadales bacterium]MBP6433745.1 heme lyase CcmF/NrfE family subunit [Sphingorhabdus sp.]